MKKQDPPKFKQVTAEALQLGKTGLKSAVSKLAEITGTDCGCNERRDSLNRIFPY